MSNAGQRNPSVFGHVAVADPRDPTHVIKPNADGSVNISGSISSESSSVSTVAAPGPYPDGTTVPFNSDPNGALRISGTINASSSQKSTAAAPLYVEGTTNPFSGDLAGNLRCISSNFPAVLDVNSGNKSNSTIRVVLATDQPAVPISAATLPLPTGASTSAKQPAIGTAGASSTDVLSVQGIAGGTVLPVSAATLPLPTGASTSALQTTGNTALGTINTTLGAPMQNSGGTVGLSGTLPAFATIPTFKIDQTTPGLTNAVDVTNLPVTVDTNSGNKSASTLRSVLATDSVALPAWGHGVSGATAPSGMTLEGVLGKTALPGAVTDGQMAAQMADKFGRSITRSAPRELLTTATLNTTGTSGTLLAAQGANVFADIYRLVIANSSAAPVLVTVSDGTNSYPFEVPANGTVGFSGPVDSATPAASTNTAWTYTVASGTTTIYIHGQFVLNK